MVMQWWYDGVFFALCDDSNVMYEILTYVLMASDPQKLHFQ
jgi:hypothetical protein